MSTVLNTTDKLLSIEDIPLIAHINQIQVIRKYVFKVL
jgi:hypothetical protein